MKRLRPAKRRQIAQDHLAHLRRDWLCRYGEWNVTKLLAELKRQIAEKERKP